MIRSLLVAPEIDLDGPLDASLCAAGLEPLAGDDGDVIDALVAGRTDLVLVPAGRLASAPASMVTLAAVLPRDEPWDVLVTPRGPARSLTTLRQGASVAVEGDRRRAFLAVHRPDLVAVPFDPGSTGDLFRGPPPVDALVVDRGRARALGVADSTVEVMSPKAWPPSAGQGARAVLSRPRDGAARAAAAALDAPAARAAVVAEIALLARLGVEGLGVVGVLATAYGRWLRVSAMVPGAAERRLVRADVSGSDDDPAALGGAAADLLLARGAGYLLP